MASMENRFSIESPDKPEELESNKKKPATGKGLKN